MRITIDIDDRDIRWRGDGADVSRHHGHGAAQVVHRSCTPAERAVAARPNQAELHEKIRATFTALAAHPVARARR